MGAFGGIEWVIIILFIFLFFGAKRIPKLARGIGQGIKEFRNASDEIKHELEKGQQETVNTIIKSDPEVNKQLKND